MKKFKSVFEERELLFKKWVLEDEKNIKKDVKSGYKKKK
jgi:hypothetical protein